MARLEEEEDKSQELDYENKHLSMRYMTAYNKTRELIGEEDDEASVRGSILI